VTLAHQDFWTHVFWAAAEGMGSLALRYYFAESKIRNFDMTIDVDEDILRLDISIHNIQIMQILQPFQHLREVKLGLLLRELLYFPKMKEHLSTCANIHDEEELRLALK